MGRVWGFGNAVFGAWKIGDGCFGCGVGVRDGAGVGVGVGGGGGFAIAAAWIGRTAGGDVGQCLVVGVRLFK